MFDLGVVRPLDRTLIPSGKDHVIADKKKPVQLPEPTAAEAEFAQQLVERAKADGVSLVGPGGLLAGITRTVLESALDAELDVHFAYSDTIASLNPSNRRARLGTIREMLPRGVGWYSAPSPSVTRGGRCSAIHASTSARSQIVMPWRRWKGSGKVG